MSNFAAPELEACPFCGTEIKQGAIVCIGCGAHKGRRMEGDLMGNFLWYIPLVVMPFLLVALVMISVTTESTLGWIITIVAGFIGYKIFRKGWRRSTETTWIRKMY